MAKSTTNPPAVDPTFMAANNAYLALKDLAKDDLAVAAAMLSQKLGVPVGIAGHTGAVSSPGAMRGAQAGSKVGGDAKSFVVSKPTTKEIERVAVYAYYLAHYMDKTEFNGKDINTFRKDIRGPAFSNIRVHIDNATRAGYLTTVGGGKKGITARGEALVEALPDRSAVNAALAAQPVRGRRGKRKGKKAKAGG